MNPVLRSLSAEAMVDLVGKQMSVGLERYTPLEAIELLKEDQQLLSVVLHELTHFHSLERFAIV
jgi:hypothetical protein